MIIHVETLTGLDFYDGSKESFNVGHVINLQNLELMVSVKLIYWERFEFSFFNAFFDLLTLFCQFGRSLLGFLFLDFSLFQLFLRWF